MWGSQVMTTPSEYAKNATSTLHRILQTSSRDFDAEGAAAVIEQAIRNATREREAKARQQFEAKARQQLKEAQSAAQERLARLLTASPAVIYLRLRVIMRRHLSATTSSRFSGTLQ
jgi:hypothetical protein